MDVYTSFNSVIVQTEVKYKKTLRGDDEAYFAVRASNGDCFYIVSFDDERLHSPYKRLQNMNLKKGAVVNILTTLGFVEKLMIPDTAWKKMTGKDENMTRTTQPMFKLIDIDFAIPAGSVKKTVESAPNLSGFH